VKEGKNKSVKWRYFHYFNRSIALSKNIQNIFLKK